MLRVNNNIKSFKKKLDKATLLAINNLEMIKDEVSNLNKQKTNLMQTQTDNTYLLKVNNELNEKNIKLKEDNDFIINNINKLTEFLDKEEAKIIDLKNAVDSLYSEIDSKKLLLEDLDKKSKLALENNDKLSKEINNLTIQKNDLKNSIIDSEKVLEKNNDKYYLLEKEIKEKEDIILNKKSIIEELSSKISDIDNIKKEKELQTKNITDTYDKYTIELRAIGINIENTNRERKKEEDKLEEIKNEIDVNNIILKEQKEELDSINNKMLSLNKEKEKLDFYREKLEDYIKKNNLNIII